MDSEPELMSGGVVNVSIGKQKANCFQLGLYSYFTDGRCAECNRAAECAERGLTWDKPTSKDSLVHVRYSDPDGNGSWGNQVRIIEQEGER